MSLTVHLPDGSTRNLPAGSTALDLAKDLGPRLGEAALAAQVDGARWDLGRPLPDGAQVRIFTAKDPEGLEVLR
ncbi:MAG TPA: TGS domain-containing protein, partial [Holophaga sp.]|nr:TGS domain-containing protein [Holophaga sp.]